MDWRTAAQVVTDRRPVLRESGELCAHLNRGQVS